MIMKITAFVASALVAITALSSCVGAEYKADENLLASYQTLSWNGDALSYDSYSKTLSFTTSEGKTDYSAELVISLPENKAKGFMFYADLGNGQTTSDFGTVKLSFSDSEGALLATSTSEVINSRKNYHRCSCAKESEFFPVDKNATSFTVTLSARDADGDGKVNVFFRNFYLLFSDAQIMSSIKPSEIPSVMALSSELSIVEVGNIGLSRWLWVGIIVVIAFAFYFLRLSRQKSSKSSLMKPTGKPKR